jgi:hypothetical protein
MMIPSPSNQKQLRLFQAYQHFNLLNFAKA